MTDADDEREYNAFWQHSRAWWNKVYPTTPDRVVDEVNVVIGALPDGGGCRYEFSVKWILLGGRPSPELCMFDDSWDAFDEVPEIFKYLTRKSTAGRRERGSISPEDFCKFLLSIGFIDNTEEVQGEGPVGLKH